LRQKNSVPAAIHKLSTMHAHDFNRQRDVRLLTYADRASPATDIACGLTVMAIGPYAHTV
jgi:hypothetical protein